MKQNSNNSRRSRGRNNNGRGRSNNGKVMTAHDGQYVAEGKNRGQLTQTIEKYLGLAREAQAGGDRVTAESYYQHADHYQRLLNVINEQVMQYEREVAAVVETEITDGDDEQNQASSEDEDSQPGFSALAS